MRFQVLGLGFKFCVSVFLQGAQSFCAEGNAEDRTAVRVTCDLLRAMHVQLYNLCCYVVSLMLYDSVTEWPQVSMSFHRVRKPNQRQGLATSNLKP